MTTLPGPPPAGGTELGADTMDLLRFATIGSVDDGKSTSSADCSSIPDSSSTTS